MEKVINPRHMREGYGSCSVCVSVTELAATYLVDMLKIMYCSQRMYCVDFVENAWFKSSGEIY